MKIYHSTQRATAILGFVGVMFLGLGIATLTFHPMVFPMIVLGLSAWIFRSLTIEISETELTWYFGPGWPRKRVLLSEVASAEVIRTSFLNGWGIHYTPRGWLYNVSGFGAVAITLRSGKRFCLGTDQPEELARHLASRR